MIISNLNYLECLFKEVSDISGGNTQVKSTSTTVSSRESPNHFATSSIKSSSLTSNDPLVVTKGVNLLQTGGIALANIV